MKKILAIILAALLALGMFSAIAETAIEEPVAIPPLQGTVTELTEDGFLLETNDLGPVMVLTTEETILEGMDELFADAYVLVYYNGMMSRSLPPQVTAEKVAQYAMTGTVIEIGENSIVLQQYDELAAPLTVTLPENAPRLFVGCMVTVYTDGVMTASMEPLVNALHVRPETISGTITSVTEENFALSNGQDGEYVVNLAPETVLEAELAEGANVVVYHTGAMTFSLPAQVSALAVIEAPAAEAEVAEEIISE